MLLMLYLLGTIIAAVKCKDNIVLKIADSFYDFHIHSKFIDFIIVSLMGDDADIQNIDPSLFADMDFSTTDIILIATVANKSFPILLVIVYNTWKLISHIRKWHNGRKYKKRVSDAFSKLNVKKD